MSTQTMCLTSRIPNTKNFKNQKNQKIYDTLSKYIHPDVFQLSASKYIDMVQKIFASMKDTKSGQKVMNILREKYGIKSLDELRIVCDNVSKRYNTIGDLYKDTTINDIITFYKSKSSTYMSGGKRKTRKRIQSGGINREDVIDGIASVIVNGIIIAGAFHGVKQVVQVGLDNQWDNDPQLPGLLTFGAFAGALKYLVVGMGGAAVISAVFGEGE